MDVLVSLSIEKVTAECEHGTGVSGEIIDAAATERSPRHRVRTHELRIFQQTPGDGGPLLLSPAELQSPISHHRIPPVRQFIYEPRELSVGHRPIEILLSRPSPSVQYVGPYRIVEEGGRLRYYADRFAEGSLSHGPYVDSVHPYGPAVDVVESKEETGYRCLAGPCDFFCRLR